MYASRATVVLGAQGYQRLVIALAPAAGAQVVKLDRAGCVWPVQAAACHAAKLGQLGFVGAFVFCQCILFRYFLNICAWWWPPMKIA
jgi:hypothetical protein